MDQGLFWSIVGALGGIVAAVLIGLATYHRQFPKRSIDWWVESTRMMASSGAAHFDSVEVKVNRIVVLDPYLNTLTLFANSRADIPSAVFDQGQVITIRVTSGGILKLDSPADDTITFGGGHGEGFDWGEVEISPQLIRKGAEGHLVFVSAGAPTVEVDSPLVDIDVRRLMPPQAHTRTPEGRRKNTIIRSFAFLAAALGSFAGGVGIASLQMRGLLGD